MGKKFQHGLFDCQEDRCLCVTSFLFPCCVFGRTASAVEQSCLYCGLGYVCCFPCLGALVSKIVRHQQGIKGSLTKDFWRHLFCPPCALIQLAREVKEAEDDAGQAVERE